MDAKVRGIIDGKLADLPKRMKIVRRRNHVNQKEMGEILGITQPRVSALEAGKTRATVE